MDWATNVHLALGWEETSGEKWYILSTEPTTLQTFQEYGLRFTIEENFKDDKSSGFNLENSKLRSVPALKLVSGQKFSIPNRHSMTVGMIRVIMEEISKYKQMKSYILISQNGRF